MFFGENSGRRRLGGTKKAPERELCQKSGLSFFRLRECGLSINHKQEKRPQSRNVSFGYRPLREFSRVNGACPSDGTIPQLVLTPVFVSHARMFLQNVPTSESMGYRLGPEGYAK